MFEQNGNAVDRVGSADVEGVPRFQRFWLGGDTLGPRVFETRSITPLRYVLLDDQSRIIDVLGDPRFQSPDDFVTSFGIPALVEVGGDRFFLIVGNDTTREGSYGLDGAGADRPEDAGTAGCDLPQELSGVTCE